MSRTCPACGTELTRKEKETESAFAKRKFCGRKCAAHGDGNPTGKLLLQSKFTSKRIHINQFLAEVMCERKAKAEGQVLPPHFWEKEPWKAFFRFQLSRAAALLKEFPHTILGAVLRSARGRTVFSLGMAKLRLWCQEEQRRQATINQLPGMNTESPIEVEPQGQAGDVGVRPTFAPAPSLRSRLRSVDE